MIALRTESRAVRGRAGRLLAVAAVALAIGASAGTGLGLELGQADARTFEEVDVDAACEDGSAYTSYHGVEVLCAPNKDPFVGSGLLPTPTPTPSR